MSDLRARITYLCMAPNAVIPGPEGPMLVVDVEDLKAALAATAPTTEETTAP